MDHRARRRIFLGDIQGCHEPLLRLLDAVAFDPARDALHPVGDVVNRGPDNVGVLRLLRKLGAEGVLGNHDVHLLRRAAGTVPAKARDTIEDVLEAPDRDELIGWLGAWPFVRAWDDVVMVHGGLHPRWKDPVATLSGIADPRTPGPDAGFAIAVRYCDDTGARPAVDDPPPGPPFAPWFDFYRPDPSKPRTVVFGHWSAMGLVWKPHLRGLDTGCVWGRTLAAWIAEEDRLVEVPAQAP